VALCAAIALVTVAGSSGLTPAAAQTAPPTTVPNFPNFSLSVDRGPGTTIDITVANTGPRAIAPPPTYTDSGFSLTLDKGSSGSTYMVAANITASPHWTCTAQYDVIGCSLPGTFGVGQTMTLSVPMNLCYPSGHKFLVFYYYKASLLDQIGNFSGPGGGCTTTHIGYMKILATAELRRLAQQYGTQVASLARQKQALEDSLPAMQARVASTQEEVDRSANAVAALVSQVSQTQAFLKQIDQQEQALPPSVRAELQARDSLDQSIWSLQDQIVAAASAGNTAVVKTLTARLNRLQDQLATLNRELAGKDGLVDQLVERWLSKLRVLKDQLFAARTQQVTALSNWTAADNALEAALGQRAILDQSLFSVAELIARLGVGITGVLILSSLEPHAGMDPNDEVGEAGWRVFAAQVPQNPLSMDKLDSDIATVRGALAALDHQREAALSNFLQAEQRASAALDNVTQVIWSTAKYKAAVDFISNLIDVVKAAKNGGLIGASAETLKKVAETLIKEYTYDAGPGRYGSKGAEEFNADFDAKLTNAYVGKIAFKTGVERLAKETVSKTAKDALNKSLGTLVFEKVYGTVPALYEQAAAQLSNLANPGVEEIKQIQEAVDAKAAQFTSLGGSYAGQPVKTKGIGTTIGDLATSILKDVAKNTIKYHFDVLEQQAWLAYFEQEIIARTYFPFYQATAGAYWKAYDTYDSLMQQKAQLLQGYKPTGDARVTRDDYFPTDTYLTILISGGFPYPCALQASGQCVGGPYVNTRLKILVGGGPSLRDTGATYSVGGPFAATTREGLGLEFRFS
jgi:hypothetical protein